MAREIWSRLGSRGLDCYVEPLCGSAAVFLARPQPFTGREVLNDYDPLLVNAWRSIQRAPDEVAEICCGMLLAESELHAVHSHLTRVRDEMRPRVEGDPHFCDVKLGAWWLFGICMKLGGGWCTGEGPWYSIDGKLVKIDEDHPLYGTGMGITRSVPCVGNRGVLRRTLPAADCHDARPRGAPRQRVHPVRRLVAGRHAGHDGKRHRWNRLRPSLWSRGGLQLDSVHKPGRIDLDED